VKSFLKKVLCFLRRNWKMAVLALLMAVGIGFDKMTKLIVAKNMYLGQSIEVIKGIFNITYIRNNGAAFGILADHPWVFNTLSIVSVLAILVYLFGFSKDGYLFKSGLALIACGGIGNMIDRLAYARADITGVIDMIEATLTKTWFGFDFAVFNVADCYVCIGAGVIILALILDLIKDSKKKKESSFENENN
jgi:signal peptidase II